MARGRREEKLPAGGLAESQGQYLREWRHKRRLSVSELAQLLDCGRSRISGIERGNFGASKQFIARCDDLLGCSGELIRHFFPPVTDPAEELLGEAAEPPRPTTHGRTETSARFDDLAAVTTGAENVTNLLREVAARVGAAEFGAGSTMTVCSSGDQSEVPEPIAAVIAAALEAGLTVSHFLRLAPRSRATLRLARQLLGFIKQPGEYLPYSVRDGRDEPLRLTVVFIEDVIGVLLLPAAPASKPETAWVYTDQEHLEGLSRTLRPTESGAPPIARIYGPPHHESPILDRAQSRWTDVLTEAETKLEGDRSLVLHGLSSLTEPLANYENRLRREAHNEGVSPTSIEAWISHVVDKRRARLAALKEQVAHYRFRDICPITALDDYAHTGKRARDDRVLEPATAEEVSAHFKSLCDLLAHNPNYELALVGDDFSNQHLTTWWEVKGTKHRGSVFLEVVKAGPDGLQDFDMAFRDPTITEAFQRYFELLWLKVPEQQRDRKYVIDQILRRVDTLNATT